MYDWAGQDIDGVQEQGKTQATVPRCSFAKDRQESDGRITRPKIYQIHPCLPEMGSLGISNEDKMVCTCPASVVTLPGVNSPKEFYRYYLTRYYPSTEPKVLQGFAP